MFPIKPVKHYIFSYASIAEWLALPTDSHTALIRVSWAAKRCRQIHVKINISYTVLVQNIENGKLHRHVDSVDAGLNRESNSHVFCQCCHFIAYMKVSKEKLFMLRMIEFLSLLSSLQ